MCFGPAYRRASWRRVLGAPGEATEALPVGEPAREELGEEARLQAMLAAQGGR